MLIIYIVLGAFVLAILIFTLYRCIAYYREQKQEETFRRHLYSPKGSFEEDGLSSSVPSTFR
jgi:hypothetical protein